MQLIKNKYLEIILLVLVFCFAGVLYLYKLDKVPAGFYVDEASPAYNAYSILKTGKDEYGKSFPILFKSMGLYLTPMYTYLSIVSIKLFGLSIFSARLVSVVSGTCSALVLYIFLKNISFFKNKYTPLVTTLIFVVTPWIFFYSRIGYEISLSYLFISLVISLLWFSLSKPKYITLVLIIGSIGTYSGFMARYLIPLLFIIFGIVYKSYIREKKNGKNLLIGLFVAALIQIPHLMILNTPAFLLKSDLVGIAQITSQAGKLAKILIFPLNFIFAFAREFLANYVSYFSFKSLFFFPDSDLQRSIPDLSVFYPWMLPVLLLGVHTSFKSADKKFIKFILLILLVTPIPAAITHDPFATHRAIAMLFPVMVIIALGVDWILSNNKLKITIPLVILVFCISLVTLWRSYFVLYANERSKVSGFGYGQISQIIELNPNTYFLIDQSRIKPFYIEYAFYSKMSPENIQKSVNKDIRDNYYTNTNFDDKYTFANIETRTINWEKDIYVDQIIIGDSFAISENQAREHYLTKEFEIKDLVYETIFVGYKTNPEQKCANQAVKSIYCNNE